VRRSARRFAVAALLLAVTAVLAGVWLGRAQPDRAARLVVREFVAETEALPHEGEPAPTVGAARGDPLCGVRDRPLDAGDQVRTLASGVVVVQLGPTATDDDRRIAAAVVDGRRAVVAPNPELPHAVVATAWRQRLQLDEASTELLTAFVVGHADRGPDPRPCPGGDPG
jgi:hypothetical protein